MAKKQEIDLGDQIGTIGSDQGEQIGGKARGFIQKEEKIGYSDEIDRRADALSVKSGWIPLDRSQFGDRGVFYPEDWVFRIKPAGVDAVKNWSAIDESNPNTVDDVFNEILRNCLSISSNNGIIRWDKLNSWDRFFVILKIREYTFVKGESKLEYDEDCQECGKPVKFVLEASMLGYEVPEIDITNKHFVQDERLWMINPKDYDVQGKFLRFYIPTLEKDSLVKSYLFKKIQQNKKLDEVFVKFLIWMLPKVSKDEKVMDKFILEAETDYRAWSMEQFDLADEIIRNIIVEPSKDLHTMCQNCGEEVKSEIRFPNGIKSLFTLADRRKKFGTK